MYRSVDENVMISGSGEPKLIPLGVFTATLQNISNSFFFFNQIKRSWPRFVNLFICQWTFGWFSPLAILNNAAINICVWVSVRVPAFISLGHILRNGIAEAYGNSTFNLQETTKSVPTAVVPFYILSDVNKSYKSSKHSNFPISLLTLNFCLFYWCCWFWIAVLVGVKCFVGGRTEIYLT